MSVFLSMSDLTVERRYGRRYGIKSTVTVTVTVEEKKSLRPFGQNATVIHFGSPHPRGRHSARSCKADASQDASCGLGPKARSKFTAGGEIRNEGFVSPLRALALQAVAVAASLALCMEDQTA